MSKEIELRLTAHTRRNGGGAAGGLVQRDLLQAPGEQLLEWTA
jgi:hypothetical protein